VTETRPLTTLAPDGRLSRKSLRDGVYDAILEMLLSDGLTPGQSLGIDTLARELGVSPSPVREALAQLEHTGMIKRTALRGYTVADLLSAEQMAELVAARAIVEVAAVPRIFPVTNDLMVSLRKAHNAHLAAARRVLAASERSGGDVEWSAARTYYEADQAFHLLLLQNCGNRYLLSMAQSLSYHLHRLRQELRRGHNDVNDATTEHSRILAAIEEGNPEAARQAMRAHLDAAGERALADARDLQRSRIPPK
jgi:DNA-binding GntR family transcriptional regulator